MPKRKPIEFTLLLASFFLYGFIAFFTERHETIPLLSAYATVFILYLYIILKAGQFSFTFWIYASILFRVLLLFVVPNLSDDFYRFIWDGRLLTAGFHPFAETPSFYMEQEQSIRGISQELFSKLNSPDFFTIYPPIAQFIFWFSAKVSPDSLFGNMIVMKIILLFSEMGSIVIIQKLLSIFKLPQTRTLLYALNPLVILELSGNIHLESVLIFFLLLSILLLVQQKTMLSAIAFAAAICVKLIPLIFLPAFFPRLGWKKAVQYYLIVGVTAIILFIPLWDIEIIRGFKNSLGYYFQKFEFNASIYYVVREVGFILYGYNIIQTVGWKLGVISFIVIVSISLVNPRALFYSITEKEDEIKLRIDLRIFIIFTLVLLTHLLFTTTVHPWYITTLLALSVFTRFRFVLLWTALIFLTYAGYTLSGFRENIWCTILEYVLVLGYLAYELLWERKYSLSPASL